MIYALGFKVQMEKNSVNTLLMGRLGPCDEHGNKTFKSIKENFLTN